jgi:succinate dehydrogenase/fumarate reductase cytochrome b subunit
MTTAPVAHRRVRWGAVAGLVLFAYAVACSGALALLLVGRGSYNRVSELGGNLALRVGGCVVVFAALFHALDGLRQIVLTAWPAALRRDPSIRTAVAFVTFALGIPASLVIVWPFVQGRLA